MPISYQFTNRKSGQVENLNDIDKAMCDYCDTPYSDRNYCGLFESYKWGMFGQLCKSSGCEVMPEHLTGLIDEARVDHAGEDTLEERIAAYHWIFETWSLSMWR